MKPVVQRTITIGTVSKEHNDAALINAQYAEVKPYIAQWAQMDTIFAGGTKGKTTRAKNTYLNNKLKTDIGAMLVKYNNTKTFAGDKDLTRQLVQDIKLRLLGVEDLVGTDQTDGQFWEKADEAPQARTGKNKTLRIYRTMKKADWATYEASHNVKDILKGHGGSLGQALHYFLKSKDSNSDDVLVEFAFSAAAQSLVDYTKISSGGEGDGPQGGKLTGKKEDNDVLKIWDEKIFSINLGKSKDRIAELNPTVTLKDKVRS
ncbi:hypothetical protein EDB95_5345 [Dinghuibacter silviterrae]|uniref:Uncharacterized protein n=2 Tax=Dinghuibacter silviterrae TaxID=1539049 RepID=A0A4R8DIU0_9BACT|nr:hypothetical protein EDB95_5345 [Dinghuibacter silviterrae]